MRRPVAVSLAVSLAVCLAVAGAISAASGQSLSPIPSPTAPADADGFFPSAAEVAGVLGVEVEATGIREDLGQWWEGTDLDPAVVERARMQSYRSPAVDSAETWAGVIVEVVRFRGEADAAGHDTAIAAITAPLDTFETGLASDLVAAGSWASDEGFGGSIVVVREGPVVVVVIATRSGVEEMEGTGQALAAIVLDRLRGADEP